MPSPTTYTNAIDSHSFDLIFRATRFTLPSTAEAKMNSEKREICSITVIFVYDVLLVPSLLFNCTL